MSTKEIAHLVAEDDRLRQRIDADTKRRREVQVKLSELRCPHAIGTEFVARRGIRFRIVSYEPCNSVSWRVGASPVLKDGRTGAHWRVFNSWDDITPDPKGDA